MRLLLDEMYPTLIARELQIRGQDVTSVHELPGRGTPDVDVLAHARAAGRAVVTENVRDYRPLAEGLMLSGQGHCGLVLTSPKRWSRANPGGLITALDELLRSNPDQPVDRELWL